MAKSKDEKIVLVKKYPFDDENTELYELPEQDMEVIRRYIRDWKSSDFPYALLKDIFIGYGYSYEGYKNLNLNDAIEILRRRKAESFRGFMKQAIDRLREGKHIRQQAYAKQADEQVAFDKLAKKKAKGTQLQALPKDLITLTIAIKDYAVCRSTLMRAIKSDRLKSYRSQDSANYKLHRLSRAEVEDNWPER